MATALAGVAALLFWASFAVDRHVTRELRETLQTHRRPFVLNGFTLRLDRHLRPAVPQSLLDNRALVIVSSDNCIYSWQEAVAWEQLFANLPPRSDTSVILISSSGTSIQERLAKSLRWSGHRFLATSLRERVAFQQENGLSWTPHTLVIDHGIVKITTEKLTPTVHRMILDLFAPVDEGSVGLRLLHPQKRSL
jgi:hypothetical protein